MTKRKRNRLVIVLSVVVLGAFWFYRFFDFDFESPELATFASPDGTKTTYLLWHGRQYRPLTILASKTSSLGDIRWIGSLDELVTFNELLWSSDSSLVAARCHLHYHFPEGTKEFLLVYGYDFESLDRFAIQRDLSDVSAKALINLDDKIEQLFTRKGGQQSCISKDNLHSHMRKLKWREWRRWRTRLNKAKEQETNRGEK
jgi:hypothetical protein